MQANRLFVEVSLVWSSIKKNNFLSTEREVCTEKYRTDVSFVQSEPAERGLNKTTEVRCFSVQTEQERLIKNYYMALELQIMHFFNKLFHIINYLYVHKICIVLVMKLTFVVFFLRLVFIRGLNLLLYLPLDIQFWCFVLKRVVLCKF